jgi:hypothetical protein
MPTVPTLNGPTVQTRAAPDASSSIHYSPDQFGAGIGRGLSAASDAAFAIQRQQDDVQVLTATNRADALGQKLINDPKDGARTKLGRDAVGIGDKTLATWDQQTDEIAKGLANDRQRLAFNKYRQSRRLDYQRDLDAHEMRQIQSIDEEQTAAALDLARTNAAEHAFDADRVGVEMGRQEQVVMQYAQRQGWTPEMTATRLQDEQAKTARAMMAAVPNPRLAPDMFERVKDWLSPNDRARFQQHVDAINRDKIAQDTVDALQAKGLPWDKALEEMRKEADLHGPQAPELLDEMKQRWQRDDANRREAQRVDQQNAMEEAHKIVLSQGWDAVPLDLRNRLASSDVDRLRALDAKPERTHDDLETYFELRAKIAEDPAGAGIEILRNSDKLTQASAKELINLQVAAAKGDSKAITDTAFDAIARAALDRAGIDKKKQKDQYYQFMDALRTQMKQFEALIGKPMNEEQARQAATGLMADVTVRNLDGSWASRMWSDTVTKKRYQVADTPVATSIADVPPVFADAAKQRAKALGVNLTDEGVVILYNKRGGKAAASASSAPPVTVHPMAGFRFGP